MSYFSTDIYDDYLVFLFNYFSILENVVLNLVFSIRETIEYVTSCVTCFCCRILSVLLESIFQKLRATGFKVRTLI